MRSSRGGLGATPSRDTTCAPRASARSHQLKAHELVAGWKNRPCWQRVIVAGPNLTSRDLTPNECQGTTPRSCMCEGTPEPRLLGSSVSYPSLSTSCSSLSSQQTRRWRKEDSNYRSLSREC